MSFDSFDGASVTGGLDAAVARLRDAQSGTFARGALRAAIGPGIGLTKNLDIGARAAAATQTRWARPPLLASVTRPVMATTVFKPPALFQLPEICRIPRLWPQPVDMLREPRVAHYSAPDEIADIMQYFAELRLVRARGLVGQLRRAYDAARERSRQAIVALTGRRAHIDPRYQRPSYQPYARDGPHPTRTVVLPYAVASYAITELLIRAPQSAASARRLMEHTPGDRPWPTSHPTLTSPLGPSSPTPPRTATPKAAA